MTVALLGTVTFNTTTGAKTVIATPSLGDLIIIICADTGYTATTLPTDNNTDGRGTYSLITSCLKATSADSMRIYVRNALIGSATSTTFTDPGTSSTGGGLVVLVVQGLNEAGSIAARQSAIQSNAAASATPTPVFANAPLADSIIIGAVFNATSPATMTPRSSPSYTEITDVGYGTPTTGLEVMTLNSGETSASIAWGGTSASAFCSLAVEINRATLMLNNYQMVKAGDGMSVSEKIR